jgi:putative transposase
MTSPPPLLYDTYYHIYNRGVNGENLFLEERNYDLFLNLYEKHLSLVTDLFAYCLLKNHFHLSLRVKSEDDITKKTLRVSFSNTIQAGQNNTLSLDHGKPEKPLGSENLGSRYVSNQFSNFFNAYAKTINKTYGRTGSLFQHPFGRVPITTDRQFWNVIAYIHQNPQKHGFVKDFREWKYSSYVLLLNGKRTVIDRAEVMKWFGTPEEYVSLHNQWVTDAQAKWFLGSDED